jgi:hypothetical protein
MVQRCTFSQSRELVKRSGEDSTQKKRLTTVRKCDSLDVASTGMAPCEEQSDLSCEDDAPRLTVVLSVFSLSPIDIFNSSQVRRGGLAAGAKTRSFGHLDLKPDLGGGDD